MPSANLGAVEAPPSNVWNAAVAPSPSGSWSTVAYAKGQWIVLGHNSEVAVSTNAGTWQTYPVPSGSWQTVAYGDGQYVALSSATANPEEIVSTNGTDWTAVAGPTGEWTDVIFDQGRFVAVGSLGQIATSTNGTQWTLVWNHRPWDLTSIAYGNGHFVAVDSAVGSTLISANGVDWGLYPPLGNGLKWGAVVFGNGTFVALDDSGAGYVATSVYGYVWALHQYSPARDVTGATFGCGEFVAPENSPGTSIGSLSSSTGATWSVSPVPTNSTANWSDVAYGAHRFVEVNSAGNIAWTSSNPDCAAEIPTTPRQVSGNVAGGQVWTYMHPSLDPGGAPVSSYRVTLTDGTLTKVCPASDSFQPNCIVKGLVDHRIYWVTAQAHNRYGYSAYSDPEFVIPVAGRTLSATTAEPVMSGSEPVVVQVTGIIANSEGIYPTSVVTVHVGSQLALCHPNPFGECLVTITHLSPGPASIYATYSGYGRSYTSPVSHVTITP
ncbi:MAG: hypothetical protein JWM55_1699 [Acidimicrobiaceae bacterium]|nr:hypothetical protein [Acidimicrobiaceae bacterium]